MTTRLVIYIIVYLILWVVRSSILNEIKNKVKQDLEYPSFKHSLKPSLDKIRDKYNLFVPVDYDGNLDSSFAYYDTQKNVAYVSSDIKNTKSLLPFFIVFHEVGHGKQNSEKNINITVKRLLDILVKLLSLALSIIILLLVLDPTRNLFIMLFSLIPFYVIFGILSLEPEIYASKWSKRVLRELGAKSDEMDRVNKFSNLCLSSYINQLVIGLYSFIGFLLSK